MIADEYYQKYVNGKPIEEYFKLENSKQVGVSK